MDSRGLPGPLRGRIGEVALETALGRIVLHIGSVLGECRGEIGALLSAIVVDGLAWVLWLVLIVIAGCRTTVMLTASALRAGGRFGLMPTALLSSAAIFLASFIGLATGFHAATLLATAVLFAALGVNLIQQQIEDDPGDEAADAVPKGPLSGAFRRQQCQAGLPFQGVPGQEAGPYTPHPRTVLETVDTGQSGHHSAQASLSS